MRPSYAAIWIRTLTKLELHTLIDEVKAGDQDAIARASEFVSAESYGMWHNRARAKLCRFFKNHPPSGNQIGQMVEAIGNRLVEGRFSEQFKDQLSMAIKLAPEEMTRAAELASSSELSYVQRYAIWVREAIERASGTESGNS